MKVVFLVFLLVVAAAIVAYTVLDNPHDFSEKQCPECHSDVVNNPKRLTGPITALCYKCHRKILGESSHEVDIFPRTVKIPADLPLTGGMLTCNTCHNVHESRFTAYGAKKYYLRRSTTGFEFCVSCHDATKKGSHVEVAVAHAGNRFEVTNRSQPLDAMSISCIGCHDGTIGSSASFSLGSGVWSHNSGSHPVGVNYQECRMRDGGLKAISTFNNKLHLYDGRVGCGTCHDMYSKIPKKLVMSNTKAELCLSCHNK